MMHMHPPGGAHALVDISHLGPMPPEETLHSWLVEAAEKSGSTILKRVDWRFEPQGYTSLLLLQESHISCHTWPEHGYVAIDIFSCSRRGDVRGAAEFIITQFSRWCPEAVGNVTLIERRPR